MSAVDYGVDLDTAGPDGTQDLNPYFATVSGPAALGQSLARRSEIPRGGCFWDLALGKDLRALLLEGVTDAVRARHAQELAAQYQDDERVLAASVAMVLNAATQVMTVSATVVTADGPFDLVLAVTALSVEVITYG